jgi:hypothetical protein
MGVYTNFGDAGLAWVKG